MTLRHIVFRLCVLALAAPGIASADVVLGRPSQSIVAISSSGATCQGTGDVIDTMIQGDGTTAPFSIPAGFAFMVTGVDFVTGNSSGGGVLTGDRIGYVLRTVNSGIVVAEGYAINTGGPGAVSGSTPLSTPMRVTSALCLDRSVGAVIGGTRTWVRGFLFKDN